MTESKHENDDDARHRVAELELELLAIRDHVIGCEAKLGELRAELARQKLRAKNEHDLVQELQDLKESTSWRVGRAIVAPLHGLRQAIKRP